MASRLQYLFDYPVYPVPYATSVFCSLYLVSHLENYFGQDLLGSLLLELGGTIAELLELTPRERDPRHSAFLKTIAFGSQNFVVK